MPIAPIIFAALIFAQRNFRAALIRAIPAALILVFFLVANNAANLIKQQSLEPVKRGDFRAMVVPLIKDQFNVALRNDLQID